MNPVDVIVAEDLAGVEPALEAAREAVARGLQAAGFVAYEAGPAFDSALRTHPPGDLPLVWFGLYRGMVERVPAAPKGQPGFEFGSWDPLVSEGRYREAVDRIRAYIAAGDAYQVNYTLPLEASFRGDPLACFRRLCTAQRGDYGAYVNTGRFQVLSASPELFFHLDGRRLRARPMKGTRPRGRWPAEDQAFAQDLARSEKDQAENLMIVDLLRNDLGRIAIPGTVRVPDLFSVERYPTVWQMTSGIEAETNATVPELFRALFPPGSVTGAPKVRMTQIARELEPHPRGVYCGCVGWWPGTCHAEFNVAIRTVVVDSSQGRARYGVGGGITWGSSPLGEWEECAVKARLLHEGSPDFELLESILFDDGYFLLEAHLERLQESAAYFEIPCDLPRVQACLEREAQRLRGSAPAKVRLLMANDGSFRVEAGPATVSKRVRLGFARHPVDERDRFLFHKTTRREVYEQARTERPECDDVILWNRQGDVTESTTANIVVELGGRRITPPVESGLLAGTFRRRLLEQGAILEGVITKADVGRATSIHLINSVRKWVDATLMD